MAGIASILTMNITVVMLHKRVATRLRCFGVSQRRSVPCIMTHCDLRSISRDATRSPWINNYRRKYRRLLEQAQNTKFNCDEYHRQYSKTFNLNI